MLILVLSVVTTVTLAALLLASLPAQAEVVNLPVPYRAQDETWYCGEAALQMVFDYWGEEVPQDDIGDVANEHREGGTFASDMMRAAMFSNMSTAVQPREHGGPWLVGYDQRPYGYAAHVHQWTGSAEEADRYEDLKDLLRGGYPVILLCWLDTDHDGSHYRVLKGFDAFEGAFLVHDPLKGEDRRLNMTLLVDDLWTYYDRWAMVVTPWVVELEAPEVVRAGERFHVTANVTYPCPQPFMGKAPAYSMPRDPAVALVCPPPFSLAPGEEEGKELNLTEPGQTASMTWLLVAPKETGWWTTTLGAFAGAVVKGRATSYDYFEDLVGGEGALVVACDAVPPRIDAFEVASGEDLVRNPNVVVDYDVSDVHSGVAGVRFSTDGGGSWGGWVEASPSTMLSLAGGDGAYTLVMEVRDAVGNTASERASILLDTSPPVIIRLELAGGRDVVSTTTVPVLLEASDATSGVELMAIRVGPGTWGPWEPYKLQFTVDLGSDGVYPVEARVRDAVGNVATASAEVTRDTTPPYISQLELAQGLPQVSTRQVALTFGAVDNLADPLEYSITEHPTGGLPFDASRTVASGGSVTLDWTLGGEGLRKVTVTVRDGALLTAEASVKVLVDTEPPVLTLVLNGGREVARSTEVTVAIEAYDLTTEVEGARVRVDTNEWGQWHPLSYFKRVNLGAGDGMRTVHVEVVDSVGNVAHAQATVLLDATAPVATARPGTLLPGGVVAEGSTIEVTFSEPVDTYTVEVRLVENASGPVPCVLEWSNDSTGLTVTPEGGLERGAHFTFTVEGKDPNGNPIESQPLIFSTPSSDDDWELVLPTDSIAILLVIVLMLVAAVSLAYGYARSRG